MAGGESGIVIVPGDLNKSVLWDHVSSDEMPPRKPLSVAEKSVVERWIANGAKWGTEKIDPFRFTTESRAGVDWWSLQPLQTCVPPKIDGADWIRNPVDAFVLAKLKEAGFAPNQTADKRTLIRRVSFDLLGLPPTPQQIDQFLADTSDHAYEHLVDRMLDSPHYGERWARHWLDVVRFGESNGFEYDEPRDNFWHYRNWVINALNADMPYDEFVRLQLAGDILRPDDVNAIAAAGFLVAGAHNTTLPSNDKMQMAMAQDELEDLVGGVCQTFLGLTANCARCHDHKFDPISQKEYYQLAAALAGAKHGERTVHVPMSPADRQRIADIDRKVESIAVQVAALEQPVREAILSKRHSGGASGPEPPTAFATWEFEDDFLDREKSLTATANGSARVEAGALILDGQQAFLATQPLAIDLEEKTLEAWVQLGNLEQQGGGVISVQTNDGVTFDAIVFGEREAGKWMAGSNGFVRTMSFDGIQETEAVDRPVHVAIVYQKDGTIVGYRDGKPYGKPYRPGDLNRFAAGTFHVLFGMRHAPVGGNRMLTGRIQRAQLYNRALTAEDIAASAGVADRDYISESELAASMPEADLKSRQDLKAQATQLRSEKEALIKSESRVLYTCVSGNAGVTRVLQRGDVSTPAEEVAPGGLSAVSGVNASFELAVNAPDAERRQRLADWITNSNNPLFTRVMVNRLWQYHFGQGMVATSSDFGFNGGKPSHPELLEWLAAAFRSNGYRLKSMHRLLVTSATYRQASVQNAEAMKLDADNRLLWRKSPLRLEAEEIRDAVLIATGKLNPEVGGRGYRDVRHFFFKGSNFYESINEVGPEANRRTIYRFTARGGRNPFLDTFDCPDPSATAPKRASTTTPLQALALMNNTLIFETSDDFAKRLQQDVGKEIGKQISQAYVIAFGREASAEEIQLAGRFVADHGMAAFCRVILNSNEFLFVR